MPIGHYSHLQGLDVCGFTSARLFNFDDFEIVTARRLPNPAIPTERTYNPVNYARFVRSKNFEEGREARTAVRAIECVNQTSHRRFQLDPMAQSKYNCQKFFRKRTKSNGRLQPFWATQKFKTVHPYETPTPKM